MQSDFLTLMAESQTLNSKVFSLVRLKLLGSLAVLGPDGATFRELKAGLEIADGVLFSNVKVLIGMGYLESEKVRFEGREMELYRITDEGLTAWQQTQQWLCKYLQCRRDRS